MRFGIREIIMMLMILAVPVVSYLAVFKPQNAEIDKARAEIEHKRELLDRLRGETARTSDLERANAEILARINEIESRLPSGKEVDSIIRQVSDLAVSAGMESPALDSEKPVTAAMYKEQPLKMESTGGFAGLYQFLQAVERMPRITRLPDMEIKRARGADGLINTEFTLSIYFQDSEPSS